MMHRSLLAALALALASLAGCGGPRLELIDGSLAVVHVSPHHGAVEVPTSPTLLLGFSVPLAADSLEGNITLVQDNDEGDAPKLDVRLFLEEGGTSVTLVPAVALLPGQRYALEIAEGLEGAEGEVLAAPFRSEFQTRR